jgi:hypothetical protein
LDPADVPISSAITADTTESGGTFAPDLGVGAANINVDDLIVALGLSNVIITTANSGVSGSGAGDIDVDAPITWSATTSLTLNADRDVNVNFAITGEDSSILANAGRDVNVTAAITTTTGRLAFTAEQDVNLNAAATVTTGELSAVAGRHVNIGVSAAITVTTGDIVLRADNDGTGPGADEGTVTIDCGPRCLTITTGELNIRFNPVSYATTDSEILIYADKLTGGGRLDAKAWVFGLGDDKTYDGNTTASVGGLMPDTAGGTAPVVWDGATNAQFEDPNVGTDRTITYESTFSDTVYDLFAREDMPVGTYQARADILPITPDPDPDTTDPADSGPGVVEPAEALPKVRAADALPQSLAIAPQAATPQGPLSSPMLPPEPIPVVAPVVAPLVLPAPPPPPPRLSPRPVFVPRTLPLLPRVPKQDRN